MPVSQSAKSTALGQGAATQTYYIHSNALYSPQAVTNEAGQVVERYSYTAFGERTVLGGYSSTTSRIGFNQGFTGLRDEGGLLFARNRFFSPELGMWTSRDPAGYVDGYSLYDGYFVPNAVDPEGKIFFLAGMVAAFSYWTEDAVFSRVNAALRITVAGMTLWAAFASVVFGPSVAAWAGDQIGTGLKEFVTGSYQDSVGSQLTQMTVGSGTVGKVLSFVYDLGPSGVGVVRSVVRITKANPFIKIKSSPANCKPSTEPVLGGGPIPHEQYQIKILEAMVNDKAINIIFKNQQISLMKANMASPVLSGVINTKTGKVYLGQNSLTGKVPENLNPYLKGKTDAVPNGLHFSTPGSHAEVFAVNNALNDGAKVSDLVRCNVWLKAIEGTQMTQLETAVRCKNCRDILIDIEFIHDLIK